MRFKWSDHAFDLEAASFTLKAFGVFVLAVVFLEAGLGYQHSRISTASAPITATTTETQTILAAANIEASPEQVPLPMRVIRKLTIADMIPKEGKFIAADLKEMQISLYEDGTLAQQYPIKTKGRPGTEWETPAGLYKIQSKEENHFSSIGKVYMPYSMQFYGNYFIHGWTYYPDGTPTPFTFSGGCIKLDTDNAKKIYEFAEVGTPVFVYDPKETDDMPSLALAPAPAPSPSAESWLVADLDTGDVYAEHNALTPENPSYASMLMAALVANETISLDKKISVPEGALTNPPDDTNASPKTFYVDDLFYPLLLQPNGSITSALTSYYGTKTFMHSMNSMAYALDMASTTFAAADASSTENTTTADDLYRLAWYLTYKKSYIWKIATSDKKSIESIDGTKYVITRTPVPSTLSVSTFSVGDTTRHIALIALGSSDPAKDIQTLEDWIQHSAESATQGACASCAPRPYRKIDL